MGSVASAPRSTLYERDFFAWTQEQARLLRERRWGDLDLANLVDEVEGVGSSERREIRDRLKVLLTHLLKWQLQPGRRGDSWRRTIRDRRREIAEILKDSPSLRDYPAAAIASVYLGATLDGADETGLAIALFSDVCPFTAHEIFDADFYPANPKLE